MDKEKIDIYFPTRNRFEEIEVKGKKVFCVHCKCGWRICINEILGEVSQKTAKAISKEIEKRLNLLVNLNELEYMEVFVEKTKEFMTDKVVQGKIEALKGVVFELEQFGVK